MNRVGPFTPDDLQDLDSLYQRALRIIPTRDVWKGDTNPNAIVVRHDVDDNLGSFQTALQMAFWEFERGYSTSYFLLHDSWYWDADHLVQALQFEELGHEVGVHVNAISEGIRQKRQPELILLDALSDLREVGLRIDGCVAHGDPLCRDRAGNIRYVNDEMFSESRRPKIGRAKRVVVAPEGFTFIDPRPRRAYQLEYDAGWLERGDYLSDSGRVWSQPFEDVCAAWPKRGQLHMLVHPDWWAAAFLKVAA